MEMLRRDGRIALRLTALLIAATVSLSPAVRAADATPAAKEIGKSPPADESAGSAGFKDWLPFVGTIGAAVIAGLFAIYELRRSTAAQRALEREKLTTARTEAELAQVRSSTREYQQQQVLPFLEQLDRVLNESYKAAYFPPYFPSLGGYVPQLRRHSDRAMSHWLLATEKMSRHRIRLLLVLGQERVKAVTSLLTQLMELTMKILEVRNEVWFQKASEHDLWEAQRRYVGIGYRLMMEIRDAVSSVSKDQTPLSESAKQSVSEALTMPLEKASAVSIPYGSNPDFCWIAIWEINTQPEWRRFLESMTHATHDEFEEQLKRLVHRLYEQGNFLDVKLTKVTMDLLEVPCLVVSLASEKRLEHFLDSELETYRQENGILWSSYRSPIEIVVGLDESQTRRKRPRPNNPKQPMPQSVAADT